MAKAPAAPENPPAAGEAERMPPEPQLQWHPQGSGQWWRQGSFQSRWRLRFRPYPRVAVAYLSLTPPDAVGLLTTRAFPPGHGGGARNPGDLGCSGGVRYPGGPSGDASNSSDNGSRKASAGPEAQAVTTGH